MNEDVPDVLGWARKTRGIYEGEQWAASLAAANIPVQVWDERFRFATENISVQPLQNSTPFIDHPYRLLQVYLPNEMIAWVFFRIEPDDENCTLLWITGARRIIRVG
jgi:hypothetical protein